MCNLSEGIYSKGIETGRIRGAVEMLREEGYGDAQIIERIMKKVGLTLKAAEKYVVVRV